MRHPVLQDALKRKIDYLRLSVTETCNLRCAYCMPQGFVPAKSGQDVLSDKEILKAVTLFAELGITSLRITGGEPLMRPGILDLISRISEINGISDIALTTNGVSLQKMALPLRKAGLNRINVSLDTLDPFKFKIISGADKLHSVLCGIDSAIKAGLAPVKINVVVFRGVNDTEIQDFVALTQNKPIHLRFIEAMPMGGTALFFRERRMRSEEVLERAPSLQEIGRESYPFGKGPAQYYKLPHSKGSVGLISALSHRFCASCNRVRLSSKGVLFPCLDSSNGTDMHPLLQEDCNEEAIKETMLRAVYRKPSEHDMVQRVSAGSDDATQMCQIGG